jgi:CRP-like cAMP-binding protein
MIPTDGLDRIELLRGLPADVRSDLAQRCAWRHFPAGALIIERDSRGQDVLFLVEGRVRITDVTAKGREVAYAEIVAGGHLGQLAALDDGPRSANATAVGDCLIAALPGVAFRDLLRHWPDVTFALLEDFAHTVRLADLRITELSTMGAVERVCRELLRRAAPTGDIVESVPTQETLAALTGTTRETVGKIMGQLIHAGLVRRKRRALELLDLAGLHAFAGLEPEEAVD